MTRILGIDVGGTFTDFVYHDPEDKFNSLENSFNTTRSRKRN